MVAAVTQTAVGNRRRCLRANGGCVVPWRTLGKELGSGAFGMVVQATAVGFGPLGTSQVAVKMLKGQRSLSLHAALL